MDTEQKIKNAQARADHAVALVLELMRYLELVAVQNASPEGVFAKGAVGKPFIIRKQDENAYLDHLAATQALKEEG